MGIKTVFLVNGTVVLYRDTPFFPEDNILHYFANTPEKSQSDNQLGASLMQLDIYA